VQPTEKCYLLWIKFDVNGVLNRLWITIASGRIRSPWST